MEDIMKTKVCPNCKKNIAVLNQVCPVCGADLTNVPITEIADNLSYEQAQGTNVVSQQQENYNSGAVAVATKKKSKKAAYYCYYFCCGCISSCCFNSDF